jgi:hypothetical protein
LPRRQPIVGRQRPQATPTRARRVFQLDERSIVNGASIHPDVTIPHHRLRDIEPIRLSIHAHDLATVAIGLDHIDEHLAIGNQFDECGPGAVAVGLRFLRRVDVLQAHVDIAPVRGPHEKTIAIEDASDRAGKILLIRTCGG